MSTFAGLDGRHKLAIAASLVCWGLSMYFSYLGFKVENTQMLWVGWIMAGVVTAVELSFNTPMHKLPLTLAVIGIMCYIYGIVTNITGFWSLQHPGTPFVWFQEESLMPIIIGFVMEVLPEPLFMWGLDVKVGGDFIGSLIGLWGGTLKPQAPEGAKYNATSVTPTSNIPSSIPCKTAHSQPTFIPRESEPTSYRPAPKPRNFEL